MSCAELERCSSGDDEIAECTEVCEIGPRGGKTSMREGDDEIESGVVIKGIGYTQAAEVAH